MGRKCHASALGLQQFLTRIGLFWEREGAGARRKALCKREKPSVRQLCPGLHFKYRTSKTAEVCSCRKASPAAPEPPGDLGLFGLNNTWRRHCRQRVPPHAPVLADMPGPRGGKTPLGGGWDPPSPWRPRGALLPTPPAPCSHGCSPGHCPQPRRVQGARLTPRLRRDGQVFPPLMHPLPERRHQPRGRLWPRLAASQTLCFFLQFLWPGSNSNTAGNTLIPALAELFFHCPPCRRRLCRHLQKPGLLFIKLLKSEAFTPRPR